MECIINELNISRENVSSTSTPGVYAVDVHIFWIKQWLNNKNDNFSNVDALHSDESTQLRKIFIKVIQKKSCKVLPLPRYKLNENSSDTPLTFSQLLQYVSQSNQRSLWKESYKKYSQNSDSSTENSTVNLIDHDQLISEILFRLYGCNLIKIKTGTSGKHLVYEEIIPNKVVLKPYDTHGNLLAALFIFETINNFFIVYRDSYENNLLDCLNFTPNLIDKNHGRGLFVIYQLLSLAKAMSERGLSLGTLTLQDIYLSENLWLQVVPIVLNNIRCLESSDIHEHNERRPPSAIMNTESTQSNDDNSWRNNAVKLEKICMLWLNGMISNLDYLKHLNILAGRSPNDPQTHFMVPWVTDFSSRCGRNWRDLTKSKYRLNKGDHQLDMTYDVTSTPDQIPHHVSDALSDITCYVYLARRTPKEILCKYVRNKWVPAEYPGSIQRMQEWTPDECIPEFYTEPTVFKSIHEDLPDLGIPSWASCVEDFITKHREALESTHVSENLHHWIDITFGYKLSGQASVKSKNVCLSLVDGHTWLRRGGTVQLFAAPHPPRVARTTPATPPHLHWTLPRDAKKSAKNDSSEEASDDDDESVSVSHHVSCLHMPPQRHRSRHKSSSRARSLSKTTNDDSQQIIETRASSHSRHYRVQRSELGKGIIYLPKEFNPIASIQALEALDNFKTKCFFSKANDKDSKDNDICVNTYTVPQDDKSKNCIINNSSLDRPDDNSFTNRMFLASHDYLKKLNQDTYFESVLKKRKNRSYVTRYTTDAAIYKHFVTENRRQDMLVIGCLIVEIFLHTQMRPLRLFNENFNERYKRCRTVLKYNFNALPKCVTYMASLLLDVQQPSLSFKNELIIKHEDLLKRINVTDKGLPFPTPAQVMQPLLAQHLIPFPQNFTVLYKLLSALHEYELTSNELSILSSYVCDGLQCEKYQSIDNTKSFFAQQIAEGKIMACITHLDVLLNQIDSNTQFDVMDIFLAHYIELLQNKETSVLAAWYLFDTISKTLGPAETRKKLMKYILNLYEDDDFVVDRPEQHKMTDGDSSSTTLTSKQKFVKLYHNIFLLQLMVRLGLQCFLDNFTQHLVEAVGGYKDVSNEINSPGHLSHRRTMANKKPRYSDDNLKSALSTTTDIFSPDTSYGSENVTTPIDKTIESNNSKDKDTDNRSENELFHFESDKERPIRNNRGKSPTGSVDSFSSNAQEVHTPSPSRDHVSPSGTKRFANAMDFNVIVTKEDNDDVPNKPTSPTIEIPTKSMFTSYLHFGDDNSSEVELRKESHSRQVKSLEFSKRTENSEQKIFNFSVDSMQFKENSSCKISDMSSESLIWLAHRLGPVLTCRYITRNLLKMLTLCYIGKDNLAPWDEDEKDEFDEISIVNSRVVGDKNAMKVINCLTSIVAMYGEQLIIFQYLPHMGELIASCRRRLSAPLEGGVVACLQLIKYLVPYMSDVKIMEQLQDTFLKIILQPALRLASTSRCAYPNGAAARRALCRKLVSALHVLALRIGPEMTRRHLCVPALQRFFLAFDKATGKTDNWPKQDDMFPEKSQESESQESKEGFLEICRDGTTAEWRVQDGRVVRADLPDLACSPPAIHDATTPTAQDELLMVFNEELAYNTYTSFAKLVGTETMERCLKNLDTVKGLCRKYGQNNSISSPLQITRVERPFQSSFSDEPIFRKSGTPNKTDVVMDHISSSNSFGSNVTLVGNRIDVASDAGLDISAQGEGFDVVSYKMDNGVKNDRHLRGDWLIYWEHEIGRADKDTRFNLKQIKLQTFAGHTHSVKSIHCLDNEHSFMSGSKDKTVKLWSLRNQGDGNATTQCNWTYTGHKKGVLSLSFIESLRLAVSTDSVVHIWDPFMESVVSQLDNIKSPVSIVRTLPGGSSTIIAATNDATVRVIDARDPNHSYELKLPCSGSTYIRCMCVWDARWVACGLASGHVAVLELRTGLPLAAWRPHDGEVLRLAAVDQNRVLSSGLDQVTALWKPDDGELITYLKGSTEPVHCLSVYNDELISGTTNNRIGVHTSLQQDASFSSTKLRSDTFKGVLTCMSVLPLNRLLLLGSDNGSISLLC